MNNWNIVTVALVTEVLKRDFTCFSSSTYVSHYVGNKIFHHGDELVTVFRTMTVYSENHKNYTNTVCGHMVGHPRCVFINYIWLKLIVEHN